MRDVASVISLHTRIYPTDNIQLSRLFIAGVNEHVSRSLGVKTGNYDAPKNVVQFGAGEFSYEGEVLLIEEVTIEDRRIQLKLDGPSRAAIACFDELVALLEAQGVMLGESPIGASDVSSCVATLDFAFSEMFVPAVSQFAAKVQAELTADGGLACNVAPRNFSFEVLYFPSEDEIAQLAMRQPRKFTIEPRAQTAVGAQRYFCTGPVDSDALQRLVQGLESDILAARKR